MRSAVLLLALLLLPGIALADEPEIIEIAVTPETTPIPLPAPPTPAPAYQEYSWDASTIDALASVYWAECNTDAEKLAVTQLIANRAAHGAPFADTIEGAAMQGHEFNRGRVSDKNREIAKVCLNKVKTQSDGQYAGISVPTSAVYMRRENGVLVLLDENWTEVWCCGK